jgi:hypothetical protein
LPDREALRVLRPNLKPDYLARRRATEHRLSKAAADALGRRFSARPVYFFLGDFSYLEDLFRPAALVLSLADLPADAITFTLGDSMSVESRRVYTRDEMDALFLAGDPVAEFGLSDRGGFQRRFIEVQVWGGIDE